MCLIVIQTDCNSLIKPLDQIELQFKIFKNIGLPLFENTINSSKITVILVFFN